MSTGGCRRRAAAIRDRGRRGRSRRAPRAPLAGAMARPAPGPRMGDRSRHRLPALALRPLARRVRLAPDRAAPERALELAPGWDPVHLGARRARPPADRRPAAAAGGLDPRLAGWTDRVPRADPDPGRRRPRRDRALAAGIRLLRSPRGAAQRAGHVGGAPGSGRGARIRPLRTPGRRLGNGDRRPDGLRRPRVGGRAAPERPRRPAGARRPRRPADDRGRARLSPNGPGAGACARDFTSSSRERRPTRSRRGCSTRRPGSPPGWSTSTGAGRTATAMSSDASRRTTSAISSPSTGRPDTIASSMRLYAAEARRTAGAWRPGERIDVPAAVADFPAEILRPPREWSERVLADLRRWTEIRPRRALRRLRGARAARRGPARVHRSALIDAAPCNAPRPAIGPASGWM